MIIVRHMIGATIGLVSIVLIAIGLLALLGRLKFIPIDAQFVFGPLIGAVAVVIGVALYEKISDP